MSEPWTDCPRCPKCRMPCGSAKHARERYGFDPNRPKALACLACGECWTGTDEEVAQARAADDAWDAELKRERSLPV